MNSNRYPDDNTPVEDLTWREQEVLMLLAARLSNREIAAQLHLAESTVKDYVSNILGKLYVRNRRQAVERAKELGLLEPDRQTVVGPPTNLPSEPTPFIGRVDEIEEIKLQLNVTRLLTLTGPGGMGKTRLALKVAEDSASDFNQGSFFVSLAPIQSAEDIIQTISETLYFPLASQEDPLQQLLRYLKTKQLLLVLDNYEHLLKGVGTVSKILQAAPGVKILATSRERLNVQGETIFHIVGMDLPQLDEAENILNFDAITLFVNSVRRIRPSFDPSSEELEVIAHICQNVQGMPLAIELAAGWLHVLSLDEIAAELDENPDILSTDLQDVPERHRSIRAVFEHSWSLLEPSEQEIFTRLSVFRGGFARDAAHEIAGASLQDLGGLVNKSVVLYNLGTGRFEIHELLRQYAQEQLEKSPQGRASAYGAHADYFAEFMRSRWGHLKDNRQLAAIDEIDADIENIRTAWRHFLGKPDAHQLGLFLNSFWLVYWVRGWHLAAVDLFKKAVEALDPVQGEEGAQAVYATAMANQAFFMSWLGLADQAFPLAEESTRILERLKDHDGLVSAYDGLSLAAFYVGNLAVEKEATDKLLELTRGGHDPWVLAFALALAGTSSMGGGDYAEARQLSEASIELSQEIGELFTSTISYLTLGHAAQAQGELSIAKEKYLRCIGASEQLGFFWAIGNATKYLGQVALIEKDYPEAERNFVRSLRFSYDLGLGRDIANHLFEFASLRVGQERTEEAVELLSLLLEQPVSQQARMGMRSIRGTAQELLDHLEEDLLEEVFASAAERGRQMDLDEVLTDLLDASIEDSDSQST